MKKSRLLGALCACLACFISFSAHSASTTLWAYENGTWYDRSSFYAGVNSLVGGIQHMDGFYVADDHTVTSLWGGSTRTFTETITGIAMDGLYTNNFLVALEPAPVPIPAAAWLFGSGLLGLIGIARKRRHK